MTDKPLSTDAKRIVLQGFWASLAEAEEMAGVNCFRRAGEYRALVKSLAGLPPEAVEKVYATMREKVDEQAKDQGGVNWCRAPSHRPRSNTS